jgi:hypothetical protein
MADSMTGLAGFGVTELRCPERHHMVTVYRAADGTLFATGGAVDGDAPRAVQCPRCGHPYTVDPAALRRAAWEKRRSFVLRR